MSDAGFAVQVSQRELNRDPKGALFSVHRMLTRNYEQTMLHRPELQDYAPQLLKGKCTTDDGYGEIPFAWYVSSDEDQLRPPGEEDRWAVVGNLYAEIDAQKVAHEHSYVPILNGTVLWCEGCDDRKELDIEEDY